VRTGEKKCSNKLKPRQKTEQVEDRLADPYHDLEQIPPKKGQQTNEQNGPERNLLLEIIQKKKIPNHPQRRNKSHTI